MLAYWIILRTGARRALLAPLEVTSTIGFYLLLVGVYGALWAAVTASSGGHLQGYGRTDLIWYSIGVEAVVIANRAHLIEELGDDIVGGGIEAEMLRPVSPFSYRFITEIGRTCVWMIFLITFGLASGVLLTHRAPSVVAMVAGLFSLVVAACCTVAAELALGALSFWLRDAKVGWFVYQKLVLLLGGVLMPLEFLPAGVTKVSWLLPFWTMAYAPGRILSGHFEWLLVIGQFMWLGVLLSAAALLFSKGERRMQVRGT